MKTAWIAKFARRRWGLRRGGQVNDTGMATLLEALLVQQRLACWATVVAFAAALGTASATGGNAWAGVASVAGAWVMAAVTAGAPVAWWFAAPVAFLAGPTGWIAVALATGAAVAASVAGAIGERHDRLIIEASKSAQG